MLILLAVALVLAPETGYCTTMGDCEGNPTAGPCDFGDDTHISTVSPLTKFSADAATEENIINNAMNSFINSPVGTGWSYHWAGGPAIEFANLSLYSLDYFAWVVNLPSVTSATGKNYPGHGPREWGGAVLNIGYAAPPIPEIVNLHWIQAYSGSIRGNAVDALDHLNPASPFYDSGGTAGRFGNGDGWFLDTPAISEMEIEKVPVADLQFEVALAGYDPKTKTVTLYGGYNWGFVYTAQDNINSTPETGNTLFLLFVGVTAIIGLNRIKRLFALDSVLAFKEKKC